MIKGIIIKRIAGNSDFRTGKESKYSRNFLHYRSEKYLESPARHPVFKVNISNLRSVDSSVFHAFAPKHLKVIRANSDFADTFMHPVKIIGQHPQNHYSRQDDEGRKVSAVTF